MDNFRDYYQLDNDSNEIANSLAERYLNLIFEERDRERETETVSQEYSGLELRDVDDNLNNLKNQVQYLERIGVSRFPCLSIGELKIPIDIFQYLEDREKRQSILSDYNDRYFYRDYFPEERLYRFLELLQRERKETIASLSFDSLRNNIKKALTSFIEIRHASFFNQNIKSKISGFFRGSSTTPPASSSSTKYLTVTLSTSHHGLDILASPAYFITWKKFGSPTSPIDGYLLPATYIFGGSGMGVPSFTHDPTPVDIPPNFSINLTKI